MRLFQIAIGCLSITMTLGRYSAPRMLSCGLGSMWPTAGFSRAVRPPRGAHAHCRRKTVADTIVPGDEAAFRQRLLPTAPEFAITCSSSA